MGIRVELTLPLPPSANNLYRNVPGKGRVLNKHGREYKQEVRTLALMARPDFFHGDVRFTMVVYFPDRRRRDLSNTLKIVEDSLKGIVYGDDSQVARIELTRRYDAARPRAEVTVEAWTAILQNAA
jgi:Holliday junction resolvase RusA-like endonuclease